MSQFNNLERGREVVNALAAHNGATVSVVVGTTTVTGTLDTSALHSGGLVKITDSDSKLWTISTYNIVATAV